jgi:glycosyltransferase involved in cell wall biosynthesis
VSNNLGGGARVHALQANRALENDGFDTVTFIPFYRMQDRYSDQSATEVEYSNDCSIFNIVKTVWRSRGDLCALQSHLKKADILFFLLSVIFNIPHVVTIHYPYKRSESKTLFYYLHKMAINNASKVIFVSEFVKNDLMYSYSIKRMPRSVVIYNASDALDVNVSCDELSICIVGELTERKGINELPELIKLLDDKIDNWQLKIYGDGPLKNSVEYLAESIEAVKYYGYESNPQTIYSGNNVLLSLSHEEAFGRTVTEGMSAGLFPLLRRSGAFPEIVSYKDCHLFDRLDELVLKLKNYSDLSVEAKKKKAKSVKRDFDSRFSISRFEMEYVDLYAGVLNEN